MKDEETATKIVAYSALALGIMAMLSILAIIVFA